MNELTPDEHSILVDAIHDSATVIHKGRMMNERIKELAEQAGIEFTYDPTETPMRAFVECWEDELDKFSELIVRECAKYVDEMWPHQKEFKGTLDVGKGLKAKFGVEE